MKALALVVLLAGAARAAINLVPAVAKSSSTAVPAPAPSIDGTHGGNPYWFKTYSTAPYKEIWTGDLALKKFSDLPKVSKAIAANGGVLTQPLGTFVSSAKDQTQQITFSFPRQNSKALLKGLRKLGVMPDPAVRSMGVPIPLEEVRSKIDVMMKEKSERGAELAKVPAAAAAEEEILEHLLMVEEVAERVVVEVRFNLTVRQK